MVLSAEQLEQVKTWVEAGETLGGLQKRIAAEFNVSMTYMDVHLLVDKTPAKPAVELKKDEVETVRTDDSQHKWD